MNRKIRRVFSIILVACMLLSLVPLHATSLNEGGDLLSSELIDEELSTDSNAEESSTESTLSSEQEISSPTVSNNDAEEIKTSDETESSLSSDSDEEIVEQQDILTMADEETEEPENDNWELGLVFYDSSIDNGKTPLTEINWDASDGGYLEGETRIITVQINYKNTNAVTTYKPGELKISIPNLIYNTSSNTDSNPLWKSSVLIGANDKAHSGYDWDFITGNSPTDGQEIYTFTNANTIEEKSNFEGSIQIVYTITPKTEYTDSISFTVERYEDECIHNYNKILFAEIKDIIQSNEIELNYTRLYIHPWRLEQYEVKKTSSKILSYDGLGNNASDYIWVKYTFSVGHGSDNRNNYPLIKVGTFVFKDKIPEDCICYDTNGNLLELDDGYFSISKERKFNTFTTSAVAYVGYPKNIYNEQNNNLNIENTVDLYGIYATEKEEIYLNKDSISINLAEYDFKYTGNLYGINKSEHSNSLYYQEIINAKTYNETRWLIGGKAIYTGIPMTVKIGDDVLFATSLDGTPEKLEDNEYYFKTIYWNPTYFLNGNNEKIQSDKYDCELWVRYKDSKEYSIYENFKNPSSTKTWSFSKDDGIVGFYFLIIDMKESFNGQIGNFYYNSFLYATTKFIKEDIPESGTVYNFDYIQVFLKDNNDNLILQNEPGIESYNNFLTKEDISTFDKNTYGTYMQRATKSDTWEYYNVSKPYINLIASKSFGNISQNLTNETFTGICDISAKVSRSNAITFNPTDYYYQYDSEYAVKGFRIYDLLPNGMELESTEQEIIDSLYCNKQSYSEYYTIDGEKLSLNQIKEKLKSNVNITKNWNNTGRTRIEITSKFDEPIFFFYTNSTGNEYSYSGTNFNFKYNYSISFDSFLEYGAVWTNYCYVDKLDIQENGITLLIPITDSGRYDSDAVDLDEDGDITDYLSYAKAQTTITSVVSTHQDVTKYVHTDKSSFSTGKVDSSYDSEYEYKLRVRTGQNDITNLVIYDSIEEYAQDKDGNIVTAYGSKSHWNGEFLGIDTSYAESKGYVVKPYYSENLYNDDGTLNSDWKEYYNPVEPVYTNGVKIKFSNDCRTYSSSDYLYIYYYQDDKYYRSSQLYGTNIAGKEIEIPSTDFYLYWHTSSTNRNYYGFSIDSIEPIKTDSVFTSSVTFLPSYEITKLEVDSYPESLHNPYNIGTTNQLWHYTGEKILLEEGYDVVNMDSVKALAFEYLDADGNAAVLPANSLTYVLIKMKSPADENIISLAYNGCRTQWQALDDYDRPVDFITGINSNIVKVSLPNSVEDKIVNLSFKKIIDATDEDFDRLKLDRDATYNFVVSLTNQETGDVINGLLDSKEGFRVTNIPTGTYIIKEEDDIWFNFVSMGLSEAIEGIDLQEVDGDYILTIYATVEADAAIEIDITNRPDEERFYDSKYDIKNLFSLTK